MYARRVVDPTRLEREHPWRGGDEGKRGRRGTISSVLRGALLSLVDSIPSLFAAKASDVNALGRTWRRRLRRQHEVGGAGHTIPVPILAAGRGGRGRRRRRR
jgi:hypothetical protein